RLGHAVRGLTVSPRRHRPLVGVDAPVGHQVQVLVEHLSVELIARQAFPAALAEDFKHHFGFLHYAYLAVLAIQSPVPLRPVVRLSRSPDWQAVTPATTTGTPSPRIARAPGSIPRSPRCTCRAGLRRPVCPLECPDWARPQRPGGLGGVTRDPAAGAGTGLQAPFRQV